MSSATSIRSLWSGIKTILAGPHKTTVVICPTAQRLAQLELDSSDGLQSCSRWPELQAGCSQACMPQVEFSAEELQDFTARYAGKNCTSCGVLLTRDDWYSSRLAALNPQTSTPQVPGPLALSLSQYKDRAPICSSCYGAQMRTG